MNKSDARKIAEKITFVQLVEMFVSAQLSIKDWSVVSSVNKGMTKGATWNILFPAIDPATNKRIMNQPNALKNMIWEFGDYLPEHLKIKKSPKNEGVSNVHHEEPIF